MRKTLALVTILVFSLHILGSFLFLYTRLFWYDILMHLLGGLWVGFLGVYLFEDRFKIFNFKSYPMKAFAIIMAWTFLVGILWEIFEFGAGTIPALLSPVFEKYTPIYADSLWDLLNDVLGAIPAALYAVKGSLFGKI